ncbi:hypothetical protein [Thalassoroseus pseudoceratinae]|uniref:hypothetical protein n=1 Tax=Thalassoroseus pseudoceratinae TaxID=2713176 RepID=UPI00142406DA|nr:hypothetical protein [Thalassoroseus pseudoceratinae]
MSYGLRRGALSVAFAWSLSALSGATTHAQVPAACGTQCQTQKVDGGTCTQTTLHPVVKTRYRKEQVVSHHQVTKVGSRVEQWCETIPETKVYNVTRDEGHYQMVWVPKPVTRQYAKTTYRQEMKQRTVPYKYTETVPRVCEQVVPEQYVCYIPVTKTTKTTMDVTTCTSTGPEMCPAPQCPPQPTCATPVAPNCAVPGITEGAIPAPMTATPVAPPTYVPQEIAPLTSGGYYPQGPNLVPDPQNLAPPAATNGQPWTSVPPRQTNAYQKNYNQMVQMQARQRQQAMQMQAQQRQRAMQVQAQRVQQAGYTVRPH